MCVQACAVGGSGRSASNITKKELMDTKQATKGDERERQGERSEMHVQAILPESQDKNRKKKLRQSRYTIIIWPHGSKFPSPNDSKRIKHETRKGGLTRSVFWRRRSFRTGLCNVISSCIFHREVHTNGSVFGRRAVALRVNSRWLCRCWPWQSFPVGLFHSG